MTEQQTTMPPADFALREMALAQARELARHGRYDEALRILDEAPRGAGPDATSLDLRARIHAQQGQWDEAESCWADAARLRPGDADGFAAARRRVALMREGRRAPRATGIRPATAVGYLAFAVATAVVIALLVAVRSDVSKTARGQAAIADGLRPATGQPGSPATGPTAGPTTGEPTGPTAGPTAGQPGDSGTTPSNVLREVGRQVRLPGLTARQLPAEIAITFDAGLFRDGTTLTPRARGLLARLGARLGPFRDRIAVDIVGYTDSRAVGRGSGYASNVELGTARAVVVREMLRAASELPTAAFSVSSPGSALAPVRGTGGPAAQARDRTVSIRISARRGAS